jgi:hypothetical protein
MKIKTMVKAGAKTGDVHIGSVSKSVTLPPNHNQTMARGLKIKSGIQAGPDGPPIIRD